MTTNGRASRRVRLCLLTIRGGASGGAAGVIAPHAASPRRSLVPGCGCDRCQSPPLVLISLDHVAHFTSGRVLHTARSDSCNPFLYIFTFVSFLTRRFCFVSRSFLFSFFEAKCEQGIRTHDDGNSTHVDCL